MGWGWGGVEEDRERRGYRVEDLSGLNEIIFVGAGVPRMSCLYQLKWRNWDLDPFVDL